jgi:hypothetical protein
MEKVLVAVTRQYETEPFVADEPLNRAVHRWHRDLLDRVDRRLLQVCPFSKAGVAGRRAGLAGAQDDSTTLFATERDSRTRNHSRGEGSKAVVIRKQVNLSATASETSLEDYPLR